MVQNFNGVKPTYMFNNFGVSDVGEANDIVQQAVTVINNIVKNFQSKARTRQIQERERGAISEGYPSFDAWKAAGMPGTDQGRWNYVYMVQHDVMTAPSAQQLADFKRNYAINTNPEYIVPVPVSLVAQLPDKTGYIIDPSAVTTDEEGNVIPVEHGQSAMKDFMSLNGGGLWIILGIVVLVVVIFLIYRASKKSS